MARVPDPRVQVLSPVAGSMVAPGTALTIVVRVAAPLLANDIALRIPGFNTLTGSNYLGETYEVSFTVPASFAGPLRLTPAITDEANQPLVGAEVVLSVQPVGAPTTLALQQRNFRVPAVDIGSNQALALFGTDAAGVRRDLTSSASGTTWASSNPSVAGVSAEGVVSQLGTGVAVVTASHRGLVDHAVFVIEDSASPLPATELTAQLSVAQSGLRLDRGTGFFVQTVTVTNTQPLPLAGPIVLLIPVLPPGVSLVSQSGTTQNLRAGTPYLSVPLVDDGLTLAPGRSTVFTLQYINTARIGFGIVPSVWRVSAQP